jgi:hypothetical protein
MESNPSRARCGKEYPDQVRIQSPRVLRLLFEDPDGNMIEVYWSTGDLSWKQPHVEPLDLSRPDEVLLKNIPATR